MTKLYVWPDASWIFADEYAEEELRSKGDDFFEVDLQALADGEKLTISAVELRRLRHVEAEEIRAKRELSCVEQELKAVKAQFRAYRDSIRTQLAEANPEANSLPEGLCHFKVMEDAFRQTRDRDIDVDEFFSVGEDGVYVRAWVFVPDSKAKVA